MTEVSRSQPRSEHTPTPWHCDETAIFAEDGVLARIPNHPENGKNWNADAAFIVDAVNTHAALKARVAELEAELASCRACREKIDCLSRGEAVQQGDGP
jgi:hypothetical protein